MYPIAVRQTSAGNETYDISKFPKHLEKICMSHRDENKALAFAFILYDRSMPQIEQILNTPRYWQALDYISGNKLTVFYINAFDKRLNSSKVDFVKLRKLKDPSEFSAEILNGRFDTENVNFPAVLFFQVHDDSIIDYFIIEIHEQKIEDTFLELQKLFREAVRSIEQVSPENYQNSKEIFQLLKESLEGKKTLYKLYRVARQVKTIAELAALTKEIVF